MKTRTDLLNHLAEKYNLQRYLEIGVQVPELNFDRIKCAYKVGVDPDPNAHATFCMISDKFFSAWAPVVTIDVSTKDTAGINEGYPELLTSDRRFDLIFIDGLHTAEQVKKDFENALKILSPNGFIVLHDCNPLQEEHTIVPRPTARGHWNGDVYKFAANLLCKKVTVDIDNGCLVYRNTDDYAHFDFDKNFPYNNGWDYFNENRKELLNLITWDEFIAIGSHV